MSGGSAVTGRRGERGITRYARPKGGRTGIRPAMPLKGLGLDGQGAACPVAIERESAEGWPSHLARGIVTEWPRRESGSKSAAETARIEPAPTQTGRADADQIALKSIVAGLVQTRGSQLRLPSA